MKPFEKRNTNKPKSKRRSIRLQNLVRVEESINKDNQLNGANPTYNKKEEECHLNNSTLESSAKIVEPNAIPNVKPKSPIKTYVNPRKYVEKPKTVESFGLPDNPFITVHPLSLSKLDNILDTKVLDAKEITLQDLEFIEKPWHIIDLKDELFQLTEAQTKSNTNSCAVIHCPLDTNNLNSSLESHEIEICKTNSHNKQSVNIETYQSTKTLKKSNSFADMLDQRSCKPIYNLRRSSSQTEVRGNRSKKRLEVKLFPLLMKSKRKQIVQNENDSIHLPSEMFPDHISSPAYASTPNKSKRKRSNKNRTNGEDKSPVVKEDLNRSSVTSISDQDDNSLLSEESKSFKILRNRTVPSSSERRKRRRINSNSTQETDSLLTDEENFEKSGSCLNIRKLRSHSKRLPVKNDIDQSFIIQSKSEESNQLPSNSENQLKELNQMVTEASPTVNENHINIPVISEDSSLNSTLDKTLNHSTSQIISGSKLKEKRKRGRPRKNRQKRYFTDNNPTNKIKELCQTDTETSLTDYEDHTNVSVNYQNASSGNTLNKKLLTESLNPITGDPVLRVQTRKLRGRPRKIENKVHQIDTDDSTVESESQSDIKFDTCLNKNASEVSKKKKRRKVIDRTPTEGSLSTKESTSTVLLTSENKFSTNNLELSPSIEQQRESRSKIENLNETISRRKLRSSITNNEETQSLVTNFRNNIQSRKLKKVTNNVSKGNSNKTSPKLIENTPEDVEGIDENQLKVSLIKEKAIEVSKLGSNAKILNEDLLINNNISSSEVEASEDVMQINNQPISQAQKNDKTVNKANGILSFKINKKSNHQVKKRNAAASTATNSVDNLQTDKEVRDKSEDLRRIESEQDEVLNSSGKSIKGEEGSDNQKVANANQNKTDNSEHDTEIAKFDNRNIIENTSQLTNDKMEEQILKKSNGDLADANHINIDLELNELTKKDQELQKDVIKHNKVVDCRGNSAKEVQQENHHHNEDFSKLEINKQDKFVDSKPTIKNGTLTSVNLTETVRQKSKVLLNRTLYTSPISKHIFENKQKCKSLSNLKTTMVNGNFNVKEDKCKYTKQTPVIKNRQFQQNGIRIVSKNQSEELEKDISINSLPNKETCENSRELEKPVINDINSSHDKKYGNNGKEEIHMKNHYPKENGLLEECKQNGYDDINKKRSKQPELQTLSSQEPLQITHNSILNKSSEKENDPECSERHSNGAINGEIGAGGPLQLQFQCNLNQKLTKSESKTTYNKDSSSKEIRNTLRENEEDESSYLLECIDQFLNEKPIAADLDEKLDKLKSRDKRQDPPRSPIPTRSKTSSSIDESSKKPNKTTAYNESVDNKTINSSIAINNEAVVDSPALASSITTKEYQIKATVPNVIHEDGVNGECDSTLVDNSHKTDSPIESSSNVANNACLTQELTSEPGSLDITLTTGNKELVTDEENVVDLLPIELKENKTPHTEENLIETTSTSSIETNLNSTISENLLTSSGISDKVYLIEAETGDHRGVEDGDSFIISDDPSLIATGNECLAEKVPTKVIESSNVAIVKQEIENIEENNGLVDQIDCITSQYTDFYEPLAEEVPSNVIESPSVKEVKQEMDVQEENEGFDCNSQCSDVHEQEKRLDFYEDSYRDTSTVGVKEEGDDSSWADLSKFSNGDEFEDSKYSLTPRRRRAGGKKRRKHNAQNKKIILDYYQNCIIPDQYHLKEGDIIWGQLARYPYWPCIITNDPNTNSFTKTEIKGFKEYNSIHVCFFGDRGRRAWIARGKIIKFTDKNDLRRIYNDLKGFQSSSELKVFCISGGSMCKKFTKAIEEVEYVKTHNLNVEEIIEYMANAKTEANQVEDDNSRGRKRKLDNAIEIKMEFSPKLEPNAEPNDGNNAKKIKLGNKTSPQPTSKEKPRKKSTEEPLSIPKEEPVEEEEEPEEVIVTDEISGEEYVTTVDHIQNFGSYSLREQKSLFKRNNLFRGYPKEKACQFCFDFGEVYKCKGGCYGVYHLSCAADIVAHKTPKRTKTRMSKMDNEDIYTKEKREQAGRSEMDTQVEIITIPSNVCATPPRKTFPPDCENMDLAQRIDFKMKEIMKKFESTAYMKMCNELSPVANGSIRRYQHWRDNNVVEQESGLISQSPNNLSEGDKNIPTTSKQTVLNEEGLLGESPYSQLQETETDKSSSKKKPSNKIKRTTAIKHVTADSEPIEGPDSNSSKRDVDVFICGFCADDVDPYCFICCDSVSKTGFKIRHKCSLPHCSRFYHPECLKLWPQTQWSLIQTTKNRFSQEEVDSFVCPQHVCHTCASDNPRASMPRCSGDKIAKCLLCPASYHSTNMCVPAGTEIISSTQIVCPRHINKSNTINTTWCLICSEGGNLICCENCPTSVHPECLMVNLADDEKFICEDCECGRLPLYDEIVWVKMGHYKWWPGLILYPNEIPHNVMNIKHSAGAFVVKFFGTYDYFWVNRGRSFLFQDGDTIDMRMTTKSKKVKTMYIRAVEEAVIAHKLKKQFKSILTTATQSCQKPPPYIKIKVSKPVGNVKLSDMDLSNITACECDPTLPNPCGPDSNCLNRLLWTECNPEVCSAGESCKNQLFEKREYPPLVPCKTEARGWGLKTLAPISKGQFIIEYVGELIDAEEYQRRIQKMHEQKDENYYFLIITPNRIIDAGPKGNVARFMNHCCQPNCETQKWTVNGETRVGLFANQDILPHTELTFNYNLECTGTERKECKCGAPNCSGFIGLKAKQFQEVNETKKVKAKKTKRKRRKAVKQLNSSNSNV
ncbi:unnamed protein product [Phyllotreta striolata]|uniref:PWWP domain-containing protein n=1 Tax=Phyllotreta striolata TaxID=444603 RepID=A0A9N9XIX4_PHYSR|nr:unnamed protein product [Phyllotreta striolata]